MKISLAVKPSIKIKDSLKQQSSKAPKKLGYCKAHQETKTEKSEDPKGNDGGYEQGGGEVDGGLCPVHREPRERVGVVGLVVLLVDPGRIMSFSI